MKKKEFTNKLLKQITDSYKWYGINMDLYELEDIKYNNGGGSITWLHKENDKKLPYAERRLQCIWFYYDENTGEVLQYNNPIF